MTPVEVTKEDIEKGSQGEAGRCPIAQAITRVMGLPCEVYPCHDGLYAPIVYFDVPNQTIAVPLPVFIRTLITVFDNGGGMEPLTFTLNAKKENPA